ncbi:hypothetical protein FB645_002079 [Coemansia sp. IMI 203386]|nr:hypothetical protein FB645_002079 [Coemansia sp. IMI 203386]
MHIQKNSLAPQASGSTPDLFRSSCKPSSQPASPHSPVSRANKHARHYSASTSTASNTNTASSAHGPYGAKNLYQGFDQDSCIAKSVSNPTPPSNTSLSEMEMRLHRLRSQVACLQDENRRLSRLSASSLASQQTLDTTQQMPDEQQQQNEIALEYENNRGFDLCRWIRGTGPKTDVLYRRHLLSSNEPITSPLFRLRRPAVVSELLQKYSEFEQPIAEFMAEHKSLDPLKPYVLSSAHEMPCSAGVTVVNDHATQNLPPLAAEEYMTHVSRLTYLVRTLHYIDIADPVFLSDPRTHLLLDLVLDLESSFTLPRVDFLRQHALTIQAMRGDSNNNNYNGTDSSISSRSYRTNIMDRPESDYVIGNALESPADASAPVQPSPISTDLEHIRHMARAISPHPDFRSCRSEASARSKNASLSSHVSEDTGGQILGDKLRPDTEFYIANGIEPPSSPRRSKNPFDPPLPQAETSAAAESFINSKANSSQRRSKNPFDPPLSETNASQESVAFNGNPAISQFVPPVPALVPGNPPDNCASGMNLNFDPKLHPVVGPRSMEVSPTPPLYQKASFSGSTINKQPPPSLHSKGSSGFSQKLRRKAVSVPHPLLPSPVSNE